MAAGQSSGTYDYTLGGAESIVEAYARIQMFGPEMQVRHVVEARRSMNLILQRASNRGTNLWAVGDQQIILPLQNGVSTYALPTNVVDLLDCYRRIYTASSDYTTIGNTLVPMMGPDGPMVTASGDPIVLGPGSGTLSSVVGSQTIALHWPAHGLSVGSPLFWQIPVSIGGIVLSNFNIVDVVVDANNVTFQAAVPARWTSPDMGATPLLATTSGSAVVDVLLPGHGLAIGSTFSVQVAVTVGGITVPVGAYSVTAVATDYQFSIEPGAGTATSDDAAFENGGQLSVATQAANTQWTDIFLWPISRDDYAMLPNKQDTGVPTQYWFNRTINTSVTVWPVPNADEMADNQFVAFVAYRMRKIQDANPVGGETLDLPSRFWDWFCAALAAACAEKFKPEQHPIKLALAKSAWDEAAGEDREKVSSYIQPQLGGYY